VRVVVGSDERTPLTDAVVEDLARFQAVLDPDEAVNIGRLEPS
jgi:hypothetical protein